MSLPYHRPGIKLFRGVTAPVAIVRALQADLRRLGYLRAGLDGVFGSGTEAAIRALQLDLRSGDGSGDAPVAIRDFNRGRVTAITGVLEEPLVACLEDLLGDPRVQTL